MSKRIVKLGYSTGTVGCAREKKVDLSELIDPSVFDAMTEEEQAEFLCEAGMEYMWQYVDCWGIIEEVEDE